MSRCPQILIATTAMPAARMDSPSTVYRNVIRRLRPAAWDFFDHDLFPTRPFDPLQRLRGQPFGDLEIRPGGGYLWPLLPVFA